MGVVLLQILQWVLRIILFLLLLILVVAAIILIVPIRYQAEGSFLEKKPCARGKITWFFYLIYMKFGYEEEFHIQVQVFGFKVFDSATGKKKPKRTKTKAKNEEIVENIVEETKAAKEETENVTVETKTANKETENIAVELETFNQEDINVVEEKTVNQEDVDELALWEKEMEAEAKEEEILAKQVSWEKLEAVQKCKQNNLQNIEQSQKDLERAEINETERSQTDFENTSDEKEKKSFSEKITDIKVKIQNVIQKIKDIIAKIQDGKLKAGHYLELWNREETQVTFGRAKTKFGKMIKAVLPRKWKLTGEVGFDNPATTGQFMGVLGAMYPVLGNKVQIVPNFEEQIINVEGKLKGHIRLGNLLYQLVSLLLNRHCFKFIKLIFDELGSSKKEKRETSG